MHGQTTLKYNCIGIGMFVLSFLWPAWWWQCLVEHVADLWTKCSVVFWLDLLCVLTTRKKLYRLQVSRKYFWVRIVWCSESYLDRTFLPLSVAMLMISRNTFQESQWRYYVLRRQSWRNLPVTQKNYSVVILLYVIALVAEYCDRLSAGVLISS